MLAGRGRVNRLLDAVELCSLLLAASQTHRCHHKHGVETDLMGPFLCGWDIWAPVCSSRLRSQFGSILTLYKRCTALYSQPPFPVVFGGWEGVPSLSWGPSSLTALLGSRIEVWDAAQVWAVLHSSHGSTMQVCADWGGKKNSSIVSYIRQQCRKSPSFSAFQLWSTLHV